MKNLILTAMVALATTMSAQYTPVPEVEMERRIELNLQQGEEIDRQGIKTVLAGMAVTLAGILVVESGGYDDTSVLTGIGLALGGTLVSGFGTARWVVRRGNNVINNPRASDRRMQRRAQQ